ncbi:MAG: hypothetical protein EHM45_01690 [Desulfobacteraceae bacterium]|nr:MAG: hypothetical protein EHM45_01690 [Desulfobacteraceae bacterium]
MKIQKIYMALLLSIGFLLTSHPVFGQDLYPQGNLESGLYYAPAGNVISGVSCIVNQNRDVAFVSSNEIILRDGFHAKAGSIFNASIHYELDSDHDGMLDRWESLTFGNLSQTANGDYDGDGISNLDEYLLNTNPCDAASRPKAGNYYKYDAIGRVTKIIRIK